MVMFRSNEHDVEDVQIGTSTPLAIVWPEVKFTVLARGSGVLKAYTVTNPGPAALTATTLA